MSTSSEKPNYGGQKLEVLCPNCKYRWTISDRDFLQHGPIRCGACGAEIQRSLRARVLEDATPGPSRSR